MSGSNSRDVKFLVTLEVDYELPEIYKDRVKMYWYFPFINDYDFSANKTVLRGEVEALDNMQATVLFLQEVWKFFPIDSENSELRITTELR